MSQKRWESIAGRIALVGVLVSCASCGDKAGKGGGGAGTSNGILWNSQSGTGTTAGAPAGPRVLWVDPNSGLGASPPPPDPEDTRTYARPGKHHAVWHPTEPLPLKNAEGDDLLVLDAGQLGTGRLSKCKFKVDLAKKLVASGPTFRPADDLGTCWIAPFPDLLRQIDWRHLGVGFWQGQGRGNCWNAILAKNAGPVVTLPTNPLPLF
jgi:hypothetical protein